MLVIQKIFISQESENYIELPFYCRYPDVQRKDGKFRLVLVDSETDKQIVLEFADFQVLVREMNKLKPYGYAISMFKGNPIYYHLVAVTKQARKFTEYVTSIDFIQKSSCSDIELVGQTPLRICESLASDNTLFNCSLISDYGSRTASLTVYDAICIYPSWHIGDKYYLSAVIGGAKYSRPDFAYRVTCSDIAKVEAMIAKSRLLRTNLFWDYMTIAKQWG